MGGAIAVDEADQLLTASISRLDELLATPLRKGGISEDGLEARMLEGNEEEERLVMRLDHALRVQEDELRRGKVDPNFARYIDALQKDVAKIRRYSSPA